MAAATPVTGAAEVAIIGAGPYGLSLAAHLRARGVPHRIFGNPMHTWRTRMPKGMLLKSDGYATNLWEPQRRFTLKHYCAVAGLDYSDESRPVGLDTFCAYGLAFQKSFVPDLEHKLVTRLEATRAGFDLRLEDGQTVHPRNVVLAVGISHFPHVPELLAALPREYCSHSASCDDAARFKGRDVTLIGSGASALDLAGLLHAAGARVRLVARKPSITFQSGPANKPRTLWQRLSQPKSGIGPSLRSLVYCEAPLLFHTLPERTRLRIVRSYLGPIGSWFMRDQVIGKVPMLAGHTLQDAQVKDGRVRLRLRGMDGAASDIATDHVIAATGYKTDLRRLPFLDGNLLSRLRMADHTPVLSSMFETSTRGLHVIGPAAANSFGPLLRFAFGARFTAQRLSTHLEQTALSPH